GGRGWGGVGRVAGECMSMETDHQGGAALIEPVMQGGRRIAPAPRLAEIRARAARELERLPEPLRRLEPGAAYPVQIAEPLQRLAGEVDRRRAPHERGGA